MGVYVGIHVHAGHTLNVVIVIILLVGELVIVKEVYGYLLVT